MKSSQLYFNYFCMILFQCNHFLKNDPNFAYKFSQDVTDFSNFIFIFSFVYRFFFLDLPYDCIPLVIIVSI